MQKRENMSKRNFSSGQAFLLGIMALMVAVLCVTIKVVGENLEARLIMTGIWIIIALWWLYLAGKERRYDRTSNDRQEAERN
jgi:Na+/melibiose symporter-like transporter